MPVTINGTTGITNPDGSAGTPSLVGTDSNTGIFFPAADTIAFSEGGAEAMRIDSSGNVGIGTSSPAAKLDVQAATATAQIKSTTGTNAVYQTFNNTGGDFYIGRDNSTGITFGTSAAYASVFYASGASPMVFFTNAAERMRIDSSGGLILAGSTAQKATGTAWSNPSDQRLKDNIRDYEKGIDELMQVRVREWEYNGKGGTVEGTKGMGVVADEVMVVLPDTVENYEAKLNADDEEVTAIKKFDATEITWLLVKTVQEQQATIVSLQDTLTALTTRITALEGTP